MVPPPPVRLSRTVAVESVLGPRAVPDGNPFGMDTLRSWRQKEANEVTGDKPTKRVSGGV